MDVIEFKTVKIRKPHNCWGCTKLVEPPAEMELTTTIDGGEINHAYWCKPCQEYSNSLSQSDLADGFTYGELAQMQAENYRG